jgi:CHAT domain-containing protein
VPSLHLTDPKPISAEARSALIFGLSKAVQGFPELPAVPREVADVQGIEGGRSFLDAAFTKTEFSTGLRRDPSTVVHIASHGHFGDDPSKTFVLTYDGKLTIDDLENDIKYGSPQGQSLELLTLSACETAAGDDRAALGLAGVALKAGARSALASLWSISDDAAHDLVVAFYRGLTTTNVSKAHALQQAQVRLLRDPRFNHPAFWAPFVLIGNWL